MITYEPYRKHYGKSYRMPYGKAYDKRAKQSGTEPRKH